MKKFTKLFLSCAMVASIAAMAAVAASAEAVNITGDLTGSYDPDTTGKITITAPADLDATQAVTFIAYEKTSSTEVAAADVVAIDQSKAGIEGADGVTNTGVKGKPQVTDEGKTYVVKIGYYNASGFTTKSGQFSLSTAPAVETMTLVVGDISGDGTDVNILDQGMMLRYVAERTDSIGNAGKIYKDAADNTKNVVVGDISGDGADVNILDQGMMLRYVAERTDSIGHAGEKVTVVKPAE